MIPTIKPDIKSPQMYSLSLYFGSQRTTGKKPVRVDRTLGAEQTTPCFSLDLRAETVGCRWRIRRSRRSGGGTGAGVVSVSLVVSSMVLGRKRRQHGERKREGGEVDNVVSCAPGGPSSRENEGGGEEGCIYRTDREVQTVSGDDFSQ